MRLFSSDEGDGQQSPIVHEGGLDLLFDEQPREEATCFDRWLSFHFSPNGVMLPSHPFIAMWEFMSK